MEQAICTSCGTQAATSAKFCAHCGAKIEVLPPVYEAGPLAQAVSEPQPTPPQYAPVEAPVWPGAVQTVSAKSVDMFSYILMMLAFAIPVFGQVTALVLALRSKTNKSVRNFAWAYLILFAVCFALFLTWFLVNREVLLYLIEVIMA